MSLLHKHDRSWCRLSLTGQIDRLDEKTLVQSFDFPVSATGPIGRSLAFFSDTHWNGRNPDRLERLISTVNDRCVDWVVFGGDAMRFLADQPAVFEYFSRLSATRAKIAVLGNRERTHHWQPLQFWRDAYAKIGFRALINEVVTDFEAGLIIAGVDDLRHGKPDVSILPHLKNPEATVLTVTHTPDAIGHQDGAYLGDLILAGHTHGGQFRLPLFGALYTSSIYGRQFDRGWFERKDGAKMFVTSGLGETGTPLLRRRLFCPAEIVFLNFVSR